MGSPKPITYNPRSHFNQAFWLKKSYYPEAIVLFGMVVLFGSGPSFWEQSFCPGLPPRSEAVFGFAAHDEVREEAPSCAKDSGSTPRSGV